VPLLCTVPGISWVLAYTIAAEIGDIGRFASPRKLAGYTGLCPRVYQSGERDLRGPLAKQGPKYLRWALVEAATHACTAAVYRDRYQQTKARIGRQRGAKVAQIDLARRLSEAIWHMLSRDQRFAPKGATDPLAPTATHTRNRSGSTIAAARGLKCLHKARWSRRPSLSGHDVASAASARP